MSHGGIKIVQNLFDKGTRLETGPVINNDHNNITDHFNNNSNCYNDKFTLQEMQDAIADTNNSAPGKDRLSYNMFKHLSEKNT